MQIPVNDRLHTNSCIHTQRRVSILRVNVVVCRLDCTEARSTNGPYKADFIRRRHWRFCNWGNAVAWRDRNHCYNVIFNSQLMAFLQYTVRLWLFASVSNAAVYVCVVTCCKILLAAVLFRLCFSVSFSYSYVIRYFSITVIVFSLFSITVSYFHKICISLWQ